MEQVPVDYVAVVIAAVLNMIINFFWYSKWLFGHAWAKASGMRENDMKLKRSNLVWGVLVSLVTAYFIAFIEGYLGVTTVSDGMFFGFCFWLGFVATTQISHVIWGGKSMKFFILNTGSKLVSFLVMGGLIGA